MSLEAGACNELEIPAKIMEEYDQKDKMLNFELSLQGCSSGLNDFDYQDLSNLTENRIKDMHQIRTLNKVPIPNEIMDHFKNIKCHCRMGLFPDIGRAWLTIDSDIYIWTYEHSRDVAYFDGLSHLIVSVGLIRPKPGVFINDVKYLLVLSTPIEVIVLGVTFGDTTKTISSPSRAFVSSTYEEMQLMNKPIFVLNTDNIAMTCIEGSADGRIFLGGRDGCLYEITYQAESNWFGKRCKKVNHSQGLISYVVPGFLKVFSETDSVAKIAIDNQRNSLYTLSEKGAIELWDLNDNSARRITRISQNDITNAASNLIKTVDASVFKPVVDICVLAADEHQKFYLIAVTQSGIRLYFADAPTIPIQIDQIMKINNLYLQHVRLPPGYSANTNFGKPKSIHTAFYNSGSMLMVSSSQQDQDLLWSLSAEPFLYFDLAPPAMPAETNRILVESSTLMHLDGQVWAVTEVRDKSTVSVKYPLREAQQPKKVIILTTQGAHIVELLKPVDLLQQVLLASHGAHHDAVKTYFEIQIEPQACATSLLLACMESMRGTELSMWATQAFFRYGGEPFSYNPQQFYTQQQHIQSHMQNQDGARIFMSTPYSQSRPASSIQQNVLQQTQYNASSSFQRPQQLDMFNLKFSAKHGGLYLHIARILRPVWLMRCLNSNLCSSITIQDCNQILSDMFAIRGFLEVNSVAGLMKMNSPSGLLNQNPYSSFINQTQLGSNGFTGSNQLQQQQKHDEAYTEEKKSLDALVRFLKYVCEVIGLWKILCEHQLHLLISNLTFEQRQIIETCQFRDLVICRQELCALLIVTIINSYLNDNASVKSISEKLREVCPTLYRNEDAVSHKATEILKLSKNCTNDVERQESLLNALELCCAAAPKLPLANICQQFTAAGFFEGVIRLCIVFANKYDPNGTALHYYNNNYMMDQSQMQLKDQEGFLAFTARMKCYEEVKNMLQFVFNMPAPTGSVANDQERNIDQQLQGITSVALQAPDQLLHVAVYKWMIANNLFGAMLSIGNNSLGDFLGRSVNIAPIDLRLADLLWKYYERNGQYSAAAKILDKLATMHHDKIPLTQRIEYLARAVMCMRSDTIGYSVHHGELLRELEDKLEVAQVQKQILDALSTGVSRHFDANQVREAAKNLDMRLFNMSQLYSDFAETFDLWECQLTILNCSHHNEPRLINSVWNHILDGELDSGGSANEKAQGLLSKVQSLATEHGIGPCFPLDFLIEQLELRCFHLKLVNSPVPDALCKMNFDVDHVLDIYSHIVTANDRIWMSSNDELYLMRSVKRVLVLLIQNNLSTVKNRRRTIAKAEDLISATLNALYTKQGTNETRDITEELRNMRQHLNSFN